MKDVMRCVEVKVLVGAGLNILTATYLQAPEPIIFLSFFRSLFEVNNDSLLGEVVVLWREGDARASRGTK